MKKTVIIVLSIVLIAALATVFFWAASHNKGEPVQVAEVQFSALHSAISTNGKIEAERIFEIRAPFGGQCRNIQAHAGDGMTAGQLILLVDDPSLQSELASARAELEAANVELQNMRRGPSREETNQAEAEVARYRLELEHARKTQETNEWLLQRDAIARFEAEQSRRELDRVRQQLEAATTRRDDIKARFTEGDWRRATARVEAARSKIDLLEGNATRAAIRAPANGTLYHFEIKDGSHVNAGELLGYFADLSRLRARAFVDEPELGQVRLGAGVEIRWDAGPKDTWKGTVRHVPSEVVTRGTRSVAEVICSIESPRGALMPNVNVDMDIITAGGPKVPTLPRNTVFVEGKDHYVWLVRAGQAVKHTVETGRGTSVLVEVTGGISVGEQVIVPRDVPVTEGMKVRISGK